MARGRDNPGQMAAPEKLTATQVSDIDGLDDWRVLLRSLHSSFRSGSMATGPELAGRIAADADAANHPPDLTTTYPQSARASSQEQGCPYGSNPVVAASLK